MDENKYQEPNHNVLIEAYNKIVGLLGNKTDNPYEEPNHNEFIGSLRYITGLLKPKKEDPYKQMDDTSFKLIDDERKKWIEINGLLNDNSLPPRYKKQLENELNNLKNLNPEINAYPKYNEAPHPVYGGLRG